MAGHKPRESGFGVWGFDSYKTHIAREAAKSLHRNILFERELPIQHMYTALNMIEFLRTDQIFSVFAFGGNLWVKKKKKEKGKKNLNRAYQYGVQVTPDASWKYGMHGRIGSFGALARTLPWNFLQKHLFPSPKFRDVKRNPEAVHAIFQ